MNHGWKLGIIVILLVGSVLFSVNVPKVKAQSTTIVDLHYPSQIVLQNGVAQVTVTFVLAYGGLPSGDAIIISLGHADATVHGFGSSTPDPCLTSWGGYNRAGWAECFVAPSLGSGTESVTLTMKEAAAPQQYSMAVDALMLDPSYKQIIGSESQLVFAITLVAPPAPATDWAVLSISLSPSNPNVGDQVTFSMVVMALSSQGTFPQQFAAVCQIDGVSCGGGSLTYPGPLGTPMTVSTQTPWTTSSGAHTLTWGVATIPVGQDPNKSNNAMSKTFTVAQVSISTTSTPEYQDFALPLFAFLALAIIFARKARKLPRQRVV